jgi:galactonate dehydratase
VRITEVESLLVRGRHYVAIHTDDGLSGLGQAACWGYPESTDQIVRTFSGYLVGQDPMRIEHHWEHLYRMAPFKGSSLSGAVSAVDLALWDIKGKALQTPVWQLLGGKCRDRVRLHLLIGGRGPAGLAEAAGEAVREGFTAVKFDPFPDDYYDLSQAALIRTTVEHVAAVREAVGPDVDLLIELHRKLRPMQALPVIEAIAPFHALLYEDPVQIDSVLSQAEVAARLTAPIGNGERMHTIWEFRELLVAGGAQYVRPDLGLAGGLTHCKKIAALAEAFEAVVVTHNFLGPLLTAASVHLDVTIPNFVVQEYSLSDERDPQPVRSSVRREGGYLLPSDDPGLGVELDLERLRQLDADEDDREVDIINRRVTDIPLRSDGSVAYSV